jgi:hypothetical protein
MKYLYFAAALITLSIAASAQAQKSDDLPDSPGYSSSATAVPTSSFVTVRRPAPVVNDGFLHSRINRILVASEFTSRFLDAVSTRQFENDPCHCIYERGHFYGTFSLAPVMASGVGAYSYSIAMASAFTFGSRALWNHGEHSRHRTIYHLAARAVLAFDLHSELEDPINNWRLIATNGKRGF